MPDFESEPILTLLPPRAKRLTIPQGSSLLLFPGSRNRITRIHPEIRTFIYRELIYRSRSEIESLIKPEGILTMKNKSSLLTDAIISQARLGKIENIADWLLTMNVDLVDRNSRTLLMHAAVEGQDSVVEKLIESGANVDLQDHEGFSALHFASMLRKTSTANIIINAGAAVDRVDKWGNTPLGRATFESRGWGEMIKLLLDSGADPHKNNNYGKSPYWLANSIDNFDIKPFYANVLPPS